MAINFPSSPSTNDTYSYGGKTWRFNGVAWEIYSSGNIGNITVTGNVTAGNLTVGNTITSGDILPSANVTYNLGSDTYRWNSLYLAGNTIDLGGAQIKADPDAGTITILPVLSTGGSSTTQALIISNTGIVTAETDSNGNISTESILAATANATNLSSSVVGGGGGGVSTVQTVIRSMIFGGG